MAHPHPPSRQSTMPDIYQRPLPSVRSSSSISTTVASSLSSTTRCSPILPSASTHFLEKAASSPNSSVINGAIQYLDSQANPTICGLPLKYVSLVTLAVQNAALSIVMHYSRVSIPPELAYSPASAVFLNELLKGTISFIIALSRAPPSPDYTNTRHKKSLWATIQNLPYPWTDRFLAVCAEIFSPDCWKLSIPAILYVVQNSLQFVAVSNLPVASFQVTYQMKILTTAAFSVALLRKKLSTTKWLSLFFLAIGVGIVQIQTSSIGPSSHMPKSTPVGSAHEYHVHIMSPLKGFGAVTAACFTSGLAGVYFEMVLKGSKADLWVRNVQLSLFSLIPALLPIIYTARPPNSQGFILDLFRNFGAWAWATVAIQVFGGLVTAVVIKYSDNILKGFATSLSIVLSFLASVALFDFSITPSFVIGAGTVLSATWMYNQPPGQETLAIVLTSTSTGSTTPSSFLSAPASPVLFDDIKRKRGSPFGSPRAVASALGSASPSEASLLGDGGIGWGANGNGNGNGHINGNGNGLFGETLDTPRYHDAPYGSPFSSRAPSRIPSRAPTPSPRMSPTHPTGGMMMSMMNGGES